MEYEKIVKYIIFFISLGILLFIKAFAMSNYSFDCLSHICTIAKTNGTNKIGRKVIHNFNQEDIESYEIIEESHKHSRNGVSYHKNYRLYIILKNGVKVDTHMDECYTNAHLKSFVSAIMRMEDAHYEHNAR